MVFNGELSSVNQYAFARNVHFLTGDFYHTALHAMRSSHEKAVRPSVRLSNT